MRKWLKEQMGFYCKDSSRQGHRLLVLAPWEIVLIVAAAVLLFGVGKLRHVGGALGQSIRDFRREKDRANDTQQSTTRESKEEKDTPPEESKEESKN